MANAAEQAKCAGCGAILPPDDAVSSDRTPCPSCGSTARLYMRHLHATVTLHGSIRGKARTPGERKPFLEFLTGSSLYRKTGQWLLWHMTVDRRGDRYIEDLIDPATGESIHHCSEPLSKHTGHGTAKPKT